MSGVMTAIQAISDEGKRALADSELPRKDLVKALSVREAGLR